MASILLLSLCACEKPVFDPTSKEGKQAIIDTVNIYLSSGQCNAAVAEIEPLYKSVHSDNEVRMIAASAYACAAGMNFFKVVGDLVANVGYLNEETFWALMAKLFPSSAADTSDRVVEGALNATDALLSAIKPGAIMLPGYLINEGSFNPGATWASDRIDDANIYMLFINMATIGGLEGRYGNPKADHSKGNDLPWKLPNAPGMAQEGCAFASSIILMADNLGAIAGVATGNMKTVLSNMVEQIQPMIYEKCQLACAAALTTCPACPAKLRDRTSCSDPDSIEAKVAAAITSYVNAQWVNGIP